MEPAIQERNLDSETLMSSRSPQAAGTQVADSSSSQLQGGRKSPIPLQASGAGRTYTEQQLKQMRAQCIVYRAFKNGVKPKKLHLEIALGDMYTEELDVAEAQKTLEGHDSSKNVLDTSSSKEEADSAQMAEESKSHQRAIVAGNHEQGEK